MPAAHAWPPIVRQEARLIRRRPAVAAGIAEGRRAIDWVASAPLAAAP